MSSSKMNSFLQRMLTKSTCEEVEGQPTTKEQEKSDAVRSSRSPKGTWMKKLGNYSPNKRQVASTPRRTTNTMKAGVDKSSPGDPDSATARKTSSPLEMPDLESIIREFEMGFLSPTKNDSPMENCYKQANNNFVKKIVAAFEVKYNTYSDMKLAQETQEIDEGGRAADSRREPSKRKVWSFNSSFKASIEETSVDKRLDDNRLPSKRGEEKDGKSAYRSPVKESSEVCKRRSGVFVVSSLKDSSEEETADGERKKERSSGIFFSPSKDKRGEGDAKWRRSGIFSSPFGRRDSKDTSGNSEIYSSPVKLERQEDSKDSSSDCSSLFKFDKEEESLLRRSDFHFARLKTSALDDTKNIEDAELDVTLPEPEETISLNGGNALLKTSTRIDEVSRTRQNSEQVSTRIDKTPKIVGAFLKKPIEVEDTSIDWIPITGKKLPRKKSLKKLLYSLTGRKLERRSKLFSSERNLNEEPRELQDSGYDERSCSSSSLSSLVSVSEVLMQQECPGYAEPERKATLTTFRSRNSIDEQEEDEAFCERFRSASLPHRKQLLLTEVPRETVKLDLGPSYPSPKVITMSLDRKTTCKKTRSPSPIYDRLPRLPKHPNLAKIPKHPFVSLTKMDDGAVNAECNHSREPSIVVKNDLYEVEFRRSCDDLCSSASCRSSSSAETTYDIPRRFLSKSENEISSVGKSKKDKIGEEPIYDVPRPRSAVERPKSSVFDEAVALKRRSFFMEKRTGATVYAVPRDLELRCDVAKIGNVANIRLTNNAAVRSLNDLTRVEARSAF